MVIVLQGIRETTLLTLKRTHASRRNHYDNQTEIYCSDSDPERDLLSACKANHKKKLNFPALTGQEMHRQVHQIKIVHMKKMITIFIRKSEKEREILKGGTGINVTKPEYQESLTQQREEKQFQKKTTGWSPLQSKMSLQMQYQNYKLSS